MRVATGTRRLKHRNKVERPPQHRDPLISQAHGEDVVKLDGNVVIKYILVLPCSHYQSKLHSKYSI